VVAVCNALSSAQLAALHPSSGGAYVYGRERLGPTWGFLAGWGFVFGKTASCAAMALAIGSYLAPSYAKAIALGSVVVMSVTNYLGVTRTAKTVSILVPSVVAVLLLVVVGGFGSDAFDPASLWHPAPSGASGILQAGALIFFAFAGYARIGTLGEEVRRPERTIPRAMILAVAISLVLYTLVGVSALGTLGAERLSTSVSPLTEVTRVAGWGWADVLVRSTAVVAAGGALLTLLAGVSRTVFAMAQNRDLPRWLGAVHERRKTPYRAEIVVGVSVMVLLMLTNLLGAVGFSSFLVLWYYAVANLAALRLTPTERRWPRFLSGLGLVGCLALGLSLAPLTVVAGAGVLLLGWLGRGLRHQRS
jgi:APA family basic amino acid/polyamine antiporter